MLLERCQFWLVSGSNKQSFSFFFLVKEKLLKGPSLCLLSTQLTNFIKHYFKLQGWINCLFSCHVWGFDLLRNQQGAACWRHTILLHLGPRILFSVPEIKQEYFHINRYPTIPSVVYITTILLVVCICLITSQRVVSDQPSHPSRHGTVHCLRCTWMYRCPPLWTATIFTSPYLNVDSCVLLVVRICYCHKPIEAH